MAIISDGTHKTPNYTSSGVPFLSVQNISSGRLEIGKAKYISRSEHNKLCERIAPQKGDILLCRIGTLGKAIKVYWDFEFSVFVSLGVLRPVASEITDYIVSFINSPIGFHWIQSVKVGGGTHTYKINLNDIPQMLICIPPLPEQRRIIEKIDGLNEVVSKYGLLQEKLDTLNNNLKGNLKKSILQDAIQGKLAPQDPTDKPASALLNRIREEKQKLLKEGKLKKKDIVDSVIFKGEDNKYYEKIDGKVLDINDEIPFDIPIGWQWCRIGQIAEFINGIAFKPEEWESSGTPIIRIQNLSDVNRPFNYTHKSFDDKFKVRDGDLLFSWSATLDAYIWSGEDGWLNQHIFRVLPTTCINKAFLFFALKGIVQSLKLRTHGLTMKHLTRGVFENYLFALPPLDEQRRIVNKTQELLARL